MMSCKACPEDKWTADEGATNTTECKGWFLNYHKRKKMKWYLNENKWCEHIIPQLLRQWSITALSNLR